VFAQQDLDLFGFIRVDPQPNTFPKIIVHGLASTHQSIDPWHR